MYKKSFTNISGFQEFGFSSEMLRAIKDVGYDKPTDIQKKAIPKIIEGRDVLAGAETGSGKTAAFVLPVLHALTRKEYGVANEEARTQQVRALILVPTRELAVQIGQEVTKFSQYIEPRIKCLSVYGGVKIEQPAKALRGGADILVSTPGRFIDLINAKAVKFNQLNVLVLDEVDRLVEAGFKDDIDQIMKFLPNKRQNLFFTATFPPEIRGLVRKILDNPEIIKIDRSEEPLIDQRVLTVNFDKKTALLTDLLKNNAWSQVLIFCSAKRTCDKLVDKLEAAGIEAFSLHGNKKQHERRDVLKEFKAGALRILVATDVAARGLDILQLPCVINYELPRSPNDYVHRIGRTGRAGEQGMAISLISHHEFQHFNVIEKRNGIVLDWEEVPGFEADEIAPPAPTRSKPKKIAKKKSSKKTGRKKRPRISEVLKELPSESAPARTPYQAEEKASPYKTAAKEPIRRERKVSKPSPYGAVSKESKPSPYKAVVKESLESDRKVSKPSPYQSAAKDEPKAEKKGAPTRSLYTPSKKSIAIPSAKPAKKAPKQESKKKVATGNNDKSGVNKKIWGK